MGGEVDIDLWVVERMDRWMDEFKTKNRKGTGERVSRGSILLASISG